MEPTDQTATEHDPARWVDLYGNYMYRYALARLSDPELAQDMVQEAFVAAIHAFGRFEGKSSIKTWLIAILKRKIVDHFRRMRNEQRVGHIENLTNGIDQIFDENGRWRSIPNSWTVHPEMALEQQEFMDVLYKCIANLPSRLAEIFMLREFEELSTEQICTQLDISESNCWVMLHRARLQLRICLEANWLDTST